MAILKILCSFSRMYDSVYKNTECPSDDVIQDDDMLDGWFIQQTKEQEERQKEKLSEDKLSHLKHGNGQELSQYRTGRPAPQSPGGIPD